MPEVVTLLHGFTLGGRSWEDLLQRMPGGWRWITPDLRGHGLSPVTPCSMEDCAGDLVALWDRLGVDRSHVVGYSMGGRLALHVATSLPERTRSLLTIGAHAGLDPEERARRLADDQALARRIEREGIEKFVSYWEGLPMFAGVSRRGPQFAAWLRSLRLANQPAGLAASLRDMGAGAMVPVWDRLGAVDAPCTLVAGEHDARFVAAAERLHESIPGSRLKIVADSGHSAQFERPDEIAEVLAGHLRWAVTESSSSTRA